MAEIIFMPQLSDTMEEGTVIKWNKKIGDKISEGEIIAEIETDKAIQDFEIDVNGHLLFIGINEGQQAKVNDILAIVGNKKEDISNILKKYKIKCDNKNNIVNKHKKRTLISPIARKMIKEMNIPENNVKNIKGSGDFGRIIKNDIKFINNNDLEKNKTYHSSIRKEIARKLTFSKFSAPHYYLFSEIIMDKLIDLRNKLNDNIIENDKISFNDFIVKASACALEKYYELNVSWNEEYAISHKSINIGIAVSIKNGLIVPVINNVNKKSILTISREIKEKIYKSKEKTISKDELSGSTFTVSNLGMFDIDSFTSIINSPNSSILSVGTIRQKPIINNSKIEIGNTMKITLSCDHRIIDGVLGSNYMKYIKNLLENPINILL